MILPNIWKNKIHVPNHQPVLNIWVNLSHPSPSAASVQNSASSQISLPFWVPPRLYGTCLILRDVKGPQQSKINTWHMCEFRMFRIMGLSQECLAPENVYEIALFLIMKSRFSLLPWYFPRRIEIAILGAFDPNHPRTACIRRRCFFAFSCDRFPLLAGKLGNRTHHKWRWSKTVLWFNFILCIIQRKSWRCYAN